MNDKIRLPDRIICQPEHHASMGIGKPYPKEERERILFLHDNFPAELATPGVQAAQAARLHAANVTINVWLRRRQVFGNLRPFRRTGNKRAEREVCGQALVDLALYRSLRCKALGAEVRAFLYNRRPEVPPISGSQLSRAEAKLDLTTVRASTTCFRAYWPINMEKRRMYWTMGVPFGVVGVDISDLIDLDEMGLFLESTNRKYGKTLRGMRADHEGQYNRGIKLNFLAAISGDNDDLMRWHEIWSGEGTTVDLFVAFMVRILDDLDERHPGRSFCFTMDNLTVHRNAGVVNEVINRGHRLVYRAPYWCVDGAIEYVFNTVHTILLSYYNRISNMDELKNAALLIFGSIPTFTPYFEHVGF